MKKYNLLYFFIIGLAAIGCRGEEEPLPAREHITKNSWQVESVFINGTADGITDYSGYRYTFREDGTYTIFDPSEREGTWDLNGNETILILDPGTPDQQEVPILERENNLLSLQFTEPATNKLSERTVVYNLVPVN
jgi:hypothetical protein